MFKKSVLVLLVLGAVALIAPATASAQLVTTQKVVVTNTSANPVPTVAQGTTLVRDVDAAAATHLGRKASDFVSLSGLFDASGNIFFLRTLPNGTATSFTIPAGKMLVITDIHWQITAGNAGDVARLTLFIDNLVNPALTRKVYNSVLTLNTAGVNGSNERMTAGILVSSAATIRPTLTTPTGALGGLFLIGYLVPEE